MKVAIIGTGYIATALKKRLIGPAEMVSAEIPADADVAVYATGSARSGARPGRLDAVRTWQGEKSWRRVIYLSSMHVYGPSGRPWREADHTRPSMCGYGERKLAEERSLPQATVLRLSHVYGVGAHMDDNGVLHRFARTMAVRHPVQVDGDGSHAWDFLHLNDACSAVAQALRLGEPGIYNIGSGPCRFTDVVADMRTCGHVTVSYAGGSPASCSLDCTAALDAFWQGPKVALAAGMAQVLSWYGAPCVS
jgi:nucleoside-diphosphate-sugar epimerase